jgi:membrane protease YdiL (CAAX protease family)
MILLGSFGPAVACIVVRKWVTHEGFSDAGLWINRTKWRYYLIAWVLPLVIAFFVVVVAVVLRIGEPNFSPDTFDTRAPAMQLPQLPSQIHFIFLVAQAMVTAVIMAPLLIGEELGWRSYLQIRLFNERPVVAAVTTGLIWGVWHSPINLRGYNYPDHPVLGLFLFPLLMVLLSIPLGWLRLKSESIWPACLGHAGVGIVGSSLTMYLFRDLDSISQNYIEALAWIGLGVFAVWIIFTKRLTADEDRTPKG